MTVANANAGETRMLRSESGAREPAADRCDRDQAPAPAPSTARWRVRLNHSIGALIAEHAGPPCIAPHLLTALCVGTDPSVGTLHVACSDVNRPTVLGVSLGRLLPTIETLRLPSSSLTQLHGTLESFALESGKIGLVQAVLVAHVAKAPSLYATLLDRAVTDLHVHGARMFVYPHWNIPEVHHRRALAGRGFHPIATLPSSWQIASPTRNECCRRCGVACKCSATLYVAYAFGTRIAALVPAAGYAASSREAHTSAAWPTRLVTAQLTLPETSG